MSGQYEKDISSTPARAIDVPGTGAIKIDSQVLQDDPVTNLDVAGRYLAEIALRDDAAQLLAAWSPQEEKRMVRRADLVIVPLLLVGIMMGSTDKNALGTAAVIGLLTGNNLVGSQYSWTSSIIFFGQLASLFPALFFMQRFRAGLVISFCVTAWGIIAMCMAACSSFAGLATCRFILGLMESLTFPGYALVLASWYSRREQVWRTAIIYSTLSSLTNGLISFGCSYIPLTNSPQPWQVLFICVGGITFLWGILMYFTLPDSPVSAWWLTDRQRCIAVMRLRKNQTGVENKRFKWYQARESLLDLKTWLPFFINLCVNVPNSGAATFNSLIINSLGFNSKQTTLLAIPTGLISWAASLIFSAIAVWTGQRSFSAMAAACVPLLSTILLYTIPRSNVSGSLGALFIIYFYWAPYVVFITMNQGNTAGYTKKVITYGVSYAGYLVGNIIGPQTFIASEAPVYRSGFEAMFICYCFAIAFIFMYYLYVRYLNRRNERYIAANPDESHDFLEDWHDRTDFEQPRFHYTI